MEATNAPATETFASYLARTMIADKGFEVGAVPEAAALGSACDILLTRSDGMTFEMICIIDGEAHPDKHFEMSPDALRAIGQECLKYSGTVNRTKMPVSIRVFEVGPGANSPEQQQRLRGFRRKSLFAKVVPSAWLVDTSTHSVWTTAAWNGRFWGRPALERLLREPRRGAAELQPPVPAAARAHAVPFLTYALLAVLFAVFAAELAFGLDPPTGLLQPSVRTLEALGGTNWTLVVDQGEWYRIVAAPFLHGGIVHIALNGFVLFFIGRVLETLVGRAWFAAIYVVSAITGSLVSLALNPITVVSVGASGAIMGLLAAAFVLSFRFERGAMRTQLQLMALQVLIPSMIPLATSATGQHVDYGAHLGGALGGALLGLILLLLWPQTQPLPRLRWIAAGVAAVGVLAAIATLLPVTRSLAKAQHENDLRAGLIPDDQLPRTNADAKSQAESLIARYPRDPRARLYRGTALLDTHDYPGAIRELTTALAQEELLKALPPIWEARLQTNLAFAFYSTGQISEARVIASQVCRASTPDLRAMREVLGKLTLCK